MNPVRPHLCSVALTALALIALLASGTSAQGTPDAVVTQVITALEESELDPVVALLEDRVILSVDGADHEGVTPRQATAELGRFLAGFSSAAPVRVREGAQPDSDRAFAELSWALPSADTGEVHRFVLFLGMEFQGDHWLINEIRILRQA